MQNIVGSLVLDRPVLGVPISTLSPWLDMLIRTDDEVFGLLDAQPHRRWIKTHTPLDGLPLHPTVTYIAVIRHPLEYSALRSRPPLEHLDRRRALELRAAAAGAPDPSLTSNRSRSTSFELPPLGLSTTMCLLPGSGPNGLADFCRQRPLTGTTPTRRTFTSSTTRTCGRTWPARCGWSPTRSTSLSTRYAGPSSWKRRHSTRSRGRAASAHPARACSRCRRDPHTFFRSGGYREWASLLTDSDIERFNERLGALAPCEHPGSSPEERASPTEARAGREGARRSRAKNVLRSIPNRRLRDRSWLDLHNKEDPAMTSIEMSSTAIRLPVDNSGPPTTTSPYWQVDASAHRVVPARSCADETANAVTDGPLTAGSAPSGKGPTRRCPSTRSPGHVHPWRRLARCSVRRCPTRGSPRRSSDDHDRRPPPTELRPPHAAYVVVAFVAGG